MRHSLFLFLILLLSSVDSYSFIQQELPPRISVDYVERKGDTVYVFNRLYSGVIFDEDEQGNVIFERDVHQGFYVDPIVDVSKFQGKYGILTLDGELIFRGKPFTGIVRKKHPNGQTFWENKWVNGKKEGTWMSWFPSGQRNGTETYKNGLLHGIRTEWYETGEQKTQLIFVNNKMSSVTKKWNNHGDLIEMVVHDFKNELGLSLDDVEFESPMLMYTGYSKNKLDPSIIPGMIAGTTLEPQGDMYQFGRFYLTERYNAVVFGVEHLYGWMQYYYRVFDTATSRFTGDYIMLSGGDGDAGEEFKRKSWVVDIDDDGTPEVFSREGVTFLDIDRPEEERETTIQPIEIYQFDATTASFVPIEIDAEAKASLEEICTITF